MSTINFRNQQYLRCGKIGAAIFFILVVSLGFGQVSKKINLAHYDDGAIHYGFQLGLNRTGFRIRQSDQFVATDTIQALYGTSSPGFSLGFLFNYRLADFFDVRFTPYVGFYERRINFDINLSDEPILAQFQSSIIELPVVFKYKSSRRGNNRMYMLGGLKTSVEVGGKKKQLTSTQLTTRSVDLSFEYGVGVDIYYELFKLSPEIRFSYGLRNLFIPDDNLYSENISELSSFTTTFFLYFE